MYFLLLKFLLGSRRLQPTISNQKRNLKVTDTNTLNLNLETN